VIALYHQNTVTLSRSLLNQAAVIVKFV